MQASKFSFVLALLSLAAMLCSCGKSDTKEVVTEEAEVLRLATTTSTRDSGLLDRLLPPFEKANNCRVDVIAVGTGAALRLGEAGDVDVVLVHARRAELAFVEAGHAKRHEEFMINRFLIVGPASDPAGLRGLSATEAMSKLAQVGGIFISRGDDSGTHKRELQIRADAEVEPWDGLLESGQGMGATLVMADEKNGYTLVDGGTWLKRKAKLRLEALVSEGDGLLNPYAAMPLDPARHENVNAKLANTFVDYLISPEAQKIIAAYEIGGEPLFTPTRIDTSGR